MKENKKNKYYSLKTLPSTQDLYYIIFVERLKGKRIHDERK